jgi:cobalt-zinc-cadmium efflux system outer membrane protein
MLKGVYELLQAKRDEINATQNYTETLKHYWIARAELERSVGGALPSSPTSQNSEPEAQKVSPHYNPPGGSSHED